MLQEIVVSFFVICASAYIFTFTSFYEGLKTDLKVYIQKKLVEEGIKRMMGADNQDPLAMLSTMMGAAMPSAQAVVTIPEAQIMGPARDVLHVRYQFEGKNWEIYVPFNTRVRADARKYYLMSNEGDMKVVHHHPGTPFEISASRLGVDSVRVVTAHEEIDYEGLVHP